MLSFHKNNTLILDFRCVFLLHRPYIRYLMRDIFIRYVSNYHFVLIPLSPTGVCSLHVGLPLFLLSAVLTSRRE